MLSRPSPSGSECGPNSTSMIPEVARNRGQSPRGEVAECLLFSVADGGFDSEIERFEGFCPVAPFPFATLSMIHRWWRFD